MPNNKRPDYVPPHRHSVDDLTGLDALFLPVQEALAAAADSTSAFAWVDIADMAITITPPRVLGVEMWELLCEFSAYVRQDGANLTSFRFLLDGTTAFCSRDMNWLGAGVKNARLAQTIVVPAGSASALKVQWLAGAGTAEINDNGRRFRVTPRPYTPQVL